MLLGGAFAVCAAPCIGTVLASILVLASSSGTIARAVVLLLAYSPRPGRRVRDRRCRLRTRDACVSLGALALPGCYRRRQAPRWSRSDCCCSSTATGGCGSRSTSSSRRSASARSSAASRRATSSARGGQARTRRARRSAFPRCRSAPTGLLRPDWYAKTTAWTSPWKKSRLGSCAARHAVSNVPCAAKNSPRRESASPCLYSPSTVLSSGLVPQRSCSCGVELFLRGKPRVALPRAPVRDDRTAIDPPDIVIADIARVDPGDVADTYPEVPLLGFTNHTDTAGLRRAHAAVDLRPGGSEIGALRVPSRS